MIEDNLYVLKAYKEMCLPENWDKTVEERMKFQQSLFREYSLVDNTNPFIKKGL